MTIEQLELRLEVWKRCVWISLGAAAAMWAGAAADWLLRVRRIDTAEYLSWLAVWLLVQGAAVFPAVWLTFHRDWRRLTMVLRFHVVFGSLAGAWLALLAWGFHMQSGVFTYSRNTIPPILAVGMVLAGVYFHLRKRLFTAPEAIFP
ncbi:MAG: hypothetical protein JW748_06980 [Anaerolineales bacterium]|nr:hypothetical protein [Anaerolineales bacterium]